MKVLLVTPLIALVISFCGSNTGAQTPNWVDPRDEKPQVYDPLKNQRWTSGKPASEGRVIKKGLLAPAAQERTEHAAFLKQSNTGLIKLLPAQRGNQDFVKIRGGGAYYSFHYLSHEYGNGSDLELMRPLMITSGSVPRSVLDQDRFSVGFAGANYGMLTNLGNVPLDEITVKDSRTSFLVKYEPPGSDPDARCERRRFVIGETVDGLLYKNVLPVQAGATYLLRSINYAESDVLVGFRVTRRDDDGSVTIAWKLLRDFTPRKLENVNARSKCSGPIRIQTP
jgi:hypothetical protein